MGTQANRINGSPFPANYPGTPYSATANGDAGGGGPGSPGGQVGGVGGAILVEFVG
jgi:hypothetical protein